MYPFLVSSCSSPHPKWPLQFCDLLQHCQNLSWHRLLPPGSIDLIVYQTAKIPHIYTSSSFTSYPTPSLPSFHNWRYTTMHMVEPDEGTRISFVPVFPTKCPLCRVYWYWFVNFVHIQTPSQPFYLIILLSVSDLIILLSSGMCSHVINYIRSCLLHSLPYPTITASLNLKSVMLDLC